MQEKKANTLSGSVKDSEVRAVRQALRRKYASRSNLDRIWQQWCKDPSQGLTVEELFAGLNKIGVTASLDQAKAVHLNAKTNTDVPFLSMEEFGKLIFTADETLPVDLTRHAKTNKNTEFELTAQLLKSNELNKMSFDNLAPNVLDKFRLRNKWRACLKNALQNITKDLLELDKNRTYQAEPRDFIRVLERRTIITEKMKQ